MHDPPLDRPSFNAPRFAELEDRAAALLGTSASVVLFQAEATLGLRALGLEPWVEHDDSAAHVVTTVRTPMRRLASEIRRLSDPWRRALISLGTGSLAEKLGRVNHTGLGADPVVATDSLEDLFAIALGRRPRAGAEAKQPVMAQPRALDLWDQAFQADADDAVAACR